MRKYALLFALIGAGLWWNADVCAAPKGVGGKSPPACGAKVLPLVAGNSWTYGPVAAPTSISEAMQRLVPAQPKQIVVTVTAVEKQGADVLVKLEEKHTFDISKDSKEPKLVEETVEATIVCNDRGKFDISPESFFFAGEPGGVHGLTFDKIERKKETSWKLVKGTIGDAEWIEEISGHFTRTPSKGSPQTKLSGGKVEIERKFTPQPQENVVSKFGSFKAEKLGVIQSGRVTLDDTLSPEGKPCSMKKLDPATKKEVSVPMETCELPANWISTLWLAEGVGMVQSLNSYAHMYQLLDATLN